MTLLVRDSEELLRSNLEFHLRQGVDFYIITDNGSVDGTAEIIDEYVRAGLAESIFEPEDTYSQGRWVTRMARRAASDHGADWVINNDDDEFWYGREGDLKQTLASAAGSVAAIEVQRGNHPPVVGVDGFRFLETMIYRERASLNPLGDPLPPKVCHRGFADIEVGQGNHAVARAGALLKPTPTDAITISHFPLRGYAAFERKIALGGAAYERNAHLPPEVGATWRRLHEILRSGELRAWYDRQVLKPEQVRRGLADGSLVVDDTVARTLGKLQDVACAAKA